MTFQKNHFILNMLNVQVRMHFLKLISINTAEFAFPLFRYHCMTCTCRYLRANEDFFFTSITVTYQLNATKFRDFRFSNH